ncbi:MAG: SapC family protein [Sphingobium sp.]|nr:SapC family protein [Sphingobium sp.]
MPNLELLDRNAHGALKMSQPRGAGRSFIQIVPDEIVEASARAPVFFTKDKDSGHFYVGVMLGFKEGENLLQDNAGRMPGFVPLDLVRGGFYISGEHIAIDREDARFTLDEGDLLFGADGEPSERLRYVQHVLGRVERGIRESDRFIAAMMELHLLEPIQISLKFDDGETIALRGLYTVSLDQLQDLDDLQVLALFRSGDLRLAYAIAQSLRQVPVLAEQRNRRLGDLAV